MRIQPTVKCGSFTAPTSACYQFEDMHILISAMVINIVVLVLLPIVSAILFEYRRKCRCSIEMGIGDTFSLFLGSIRYQYFCCEVQVCQQQVWSNMPCNFVTVGKLILGSSPLHNAKLMGHMPPNPPKKYIHYTRSIRAWICIINVMHHFCWSPAYPDLPWIWMFMDISMCGYQTWAMLWLYPWICDVGI